MSYKSYATAQQLVDKLKLRFSDARFAGFDTDGFPLVAFGTLAAGSQSALIKVKDVPQIGKDSLGLAQETFCPEVIQAIVELSATANLALLTLSNLSKMLNELVGVGASKVEVYTSANTVAVTAAAIIPGNLVVELWGDLKYRQLTGQ